MPFGPLLMLVFMAACMAMMLFMMRRHSLPGGNGPMAFSDTRLGPWRTVGNGGASRDQASPAFREYREQTLRRLEEEETAFKRFLDQLRSAKDKAEFDRFMTQRKSD
jgi:hypothetical protein